VGPSDATRLSARGSAWGALPGLASGALSGALSGVVAAWLALTLALPAPANAQPAGPSAEALAAESRVQQGYALRSILGDIDRIERIAFPLQRAAAPYCEGRRQASGGAAPRSAGQLPAALRAAAPDVGLDDRSRFNTVLPGSPLALAGVQPGDGLLALGGQTAPEGVAAAGWFQQQVDQQWARQPGPLPLRVLRGARPLELALTPQPVCTLVLNYVMNDAVNAAAGPGQLLVASGMLRFATDDADLAVVLAHELAHAVLRHPDAALEAARARGDRGNTPARDPYRQDKERDADRLGLYLAAAAGFDITRAAELWRRMAAREPGAIQGGFGTTHPSTPERFLRLQAVAGEVAARQARGDTLTPPLAELKLQQDAPGGSRAAEEAARPGNLPAPAAVAGLNDEARAAYTAFLALRERPRALALSPRGHVAMHSGEDAASEALAQCNALARGACRLVALDDGWLGAPFVSVEALPAAQ